MNPPADLSRCPFLVTLAAITSSGGGHCFPSTWSFPKNGLSHRFSTTKCEMWQTLWVTDLPAGLLPWQVTGDKPPGYKRSCGVRKNMQEDRKPQSACTAHLTWRKGAKLLVFSHSSILLLFKSEMPFEDERLILAWLILNNTGWVRRIHSLWMKRCSLLPCKQLKDPAHRNERPMLMLYNCQFSWRSVQ